MVHLSTDDWLGKSNCACITSSSFGAIFQIQFNFDYSRSWDHLNKSESPEVRKKLALWVIRTCENNPHITYTSAN